MRVKRGMPKRRRRWVLSFRHGLMWSIRDARLILYVCVPQPVFLYIEYLGKKLAVDRAAGTLANADDLDYPKQTVLKFSNLPEDGDWKELKTSLVDGGFAETFMSYPKGAPAGSLCMKSNEPITDDEVEKIKGLGLALGDKTVDWRRATGEFFGEPIQPI